MKNRDEDGASRLHREFRSRPEWLRFGLVVLVFGLLLWARFLLVTGHPRTAIADPAERPAAAAAAGSPASPAERHAQAADPQP